MSGEFDSLNKLAWTDKEVVGGQINPPPRMEFWNLEYELKFRHNATQDWYSHFNLYSQHISAAYGHHQVSSLC
jgi:hypothetical protein